MAPSHFMPRRWALAKWCALVLLLALARAGAAAEPTFPPLSGRVVDDAGILSPSTVNQLTAMLAQHEKATGQQVVVVTLASLQGYSIEDFGYQLGRFWGIGQKGRNTGALLIVAPKERKVRIEVGYGLEGELTDARSSVIIQNDILPQFRRGDFNAGVIAGTMAVLRVLGGNPESVAQSNISNTVQHWTNSPWFFLLLVLGWLIVVSVMRRLGHNSGLIRRVGRSGYMGGGFYGGWGGGSSGGGGGFSGGGGSFGGGGASGGW